MAAGWWKTRAEVEAAAAAERRLEKGKGRYVAPVAPTTVAPEARGRGGGAGALASRVARAAAPTAADRVNMNNAWRAWRWAYSNNMAQRSKRRYMGINK